MNCPFHSGNPHQTWSCRCHSSWRRYHRICHHHRTNNWFKFSFSFDNLRYCHWDYPTSQFRSSWWVFFVNSVFVFDFSCDCSLVPTLTITSRRRHVNTMHTFTVVCSFHLEGTFCWMDFTSCPVHCRCYRWVCKMMSINWRYFIWGLLFHSKFHHDQTVTPHGECRKRFLSMYSKDGGVFINLSFANSTLLESLLSFPFGNIFVHHIQLGSQSLLNM